MSDTVLEMLRTKHEEIEQYEKALAKAITYKDNNPKEKVNAEIIMKKCIEEIQSLSKSAITLYEDKNGLYREEGQVMLGHKRYHENSKKKFDIWSNFYDQLKEIKQINKTSNTDMVAQNGEKIFNMLLEEVNNKLIFTVEESKGRCLDLHNVYDLFINIKNIKKCDYLEYIDLFSNFSSIDISIKITDEYNFYLEALLKYLKDFFIKINPLVDYNEILDAIDSKFDIDWNNRTIKGWEWIPKSKENSDEEKKETSTNDEKEKESQAITNENTQPNKIFYCEVCNRVFAKEVVFNQHIQSPKHKKKEKSFQGTVGEYEILHNLAYLEYQISTYASILSETVTNTKNHIRRKQAMSIEELDIDLNNDIGKIDMDELDEDKKPIYNPKNIPIGWDGKPIPYWLYKIHGLGKEYKCEICGGASYWGRRAFEHHFQEWRHTYGMKCLRLPNTLQFKEITSIEDALKLHKKILDDQKNEEFRPDIDEEFEDQDGNVVNKNLFCDLIRQGIIKQQ